MIPKVTLMELYKDVFKRSTLIAIPNISELLEVEGSEFSKWEVFHSIVRDSLKTYELYYPLCHIQKMYLVIDSNQRVSKLNGNFESYLKGIVDESQTCIVPSSVIGLSSNYMGASSFPLRGFKYNAPYLTDCLYSTGIYYVKCISKRPIPEIYDEVTGKPTDDCAVYWMSKDIDSQYSIFRDQLYVMVCRYLLNLKKNLMLQNMPIELFQGLEEDMGKIESDLQNMYQQALPASYWID